MDALKNRRERLEGEAHSVQEAECIWTYMSIPDTAQRSHPDAQQVFGHPS